MRRSLVAVLSAFALVVLLAGSATARHAIPSSIPPHVAGIVFEGTAATGAIKSPVVVDTSTFPPTVTPLPAASEVGWSFTIGTGVGYHYEPPPDGGSGKPGPYVGVGPPSGTVGGTSAKVKAGEGSIGPYCGYSSGVGGAGTITVTENVSTPPVPPNTSSIAIGVADVGWIQSAATIIVYDGHVVADNGAPTGGIIAGVVSAIPPNPVTNAAGGSCLNGTAVSFQIVGAGVAVFD